MSNKKEFKVCTRPKYWGDICINCTGWRSIHIMPSYYEREAKRILEGVKYAKDKR